MKTAGEVEAAWDAAAAGAATTHLRSRQARTGQSKKGRVSVGGKIMPLSVNGIFCTLVLLVLWRTEELAEACSCAPVHPQQAFCNADVGESSAEALVVVYLCCSCTSAGSLQLHIRFSAR